MDVEPAVNLLERFRRSPPEVVLFNGLHLPHPNLRFGAKELQNDEAYVNSAVVQVERVISECGLTAGSEVLDFGSGQGRFAQGLLVRLPRIRRYCGVDAHAPSVEWCRRHVGTRHPAFEFLHLDAYNARYNPFCNGGSRAPALPFEADQFDIAFLNSVFSHMLVNDVRHYSGELFRVLRPGGCMFLTAFLEDDVPPVSVNPAGYLEEFGKSNGPLHRVRYERGFFESILLAVGFHVRTVDYRSEPRGQSAVIVNRPA